MRWILLAAVMASTLCMAQPRRGGASHAETTQIINDCERRTNNFKKTLDRALGRDNVRAGQQREDNLNDAAKRLENEMDKVGDAWNRDRNPERARDHVRVAIGFANDINRAMRKWRMGPDAESEWAAIRNDLNRLARTFGLQRVR